MATVVKTYNATIGAGTNKVRPLNIVELAEELGNGIGLVTSVQFSHATPPAFVAHNAHRENYEEITRELILASPLEVIMGAGHLFYDENSKPWSPGSFTYVSGWDIREALTQGTAGKDADGDGIADPWALIQHREEFQRLAAGVTPKQVIGMAQVATTLQQDRDGDKQAPPYAVPCIQTVPTLEEMVRATFIILDDDSDGFFLMIEGSAVDWPAHKNQSGRMIEEQIGFNWATVAVVNWVEQDSNWEVALVVAMAAHKAGYLTGPNSGVQVYGKPIWQPIENRGQGLLPGMQWNTSDHTNSLVRFFAKGAGNEWFHRVANQLDPVRGKYLDNVAVGNALFLLPKGEALSH